ncbi:phage head closure protein [Pseudomonas otitidis]|uniref:Phage head closure protein n=1 Tax=Metapseudomonas otitidis TaxID=319939 RepID=A0A7X3KX40_9GAMM|nr:phage head closure protein [Pseudomonas otitidis]MWK58713.1 phage head closure protein [Pseudomonas otitidis]
MEAGRLRHRVAFQQLLDQQDPQSGDPVKAWVTVWDRVPAAIEPLSARDFIAAKAAQSEVSARITIRYRPGVSSSMRILHGTKVYAIAGVLPDPKSGREYLTLPVSEGVRDG